MEDSISTFCSTLASFCTHLQTNCDALTQSVQRRPIPLGSASSTFIRGLERRVTSANDDLNLLESMSFATVSFEELLGHCYEVFKSNQADISEIEDRLKDFGYCTDSDKENAEMTFLSTPSSMNPKHWWPDDKLDSLSSFHEPTLSTESTMKVVNEDPIESFSLKNLGLSDISIANLASEEETITGGKVVIDVSYFGLHVHSETIDLCKETSCPVSAGDFVIAHSQVLPGFTPPGLYSLKMKIEDENNDQLTCIGFEFRIGVGLESDVASS